MHIPNGAQIFVESGAGATLTATAITNAVNPVMTVADTSTITVGQYVIFESATWSKLANRVLRVTAKTETTVTVEGLDTTDLNKFPAGASATFRAVTSWVEIPCVQEISSEGGEQNTLTYQCLSDDFEQSIPTTKSAITLTYTFAHEFDNAVYPIFRDADESGDVLAFRMFVPKAGEMRTWSGNLSFSEVPQTSVNEIETVSISVTLRGRYTFMAAE